MKSWALLAMLLLGAFLSAGCAAPCGVIAPGACVPGGALGPCDLPCGEECDCCDGCEPCCCGVAGCCPVPTWGPLSPLFAIFCWGYPDNGCGDWYFGDWPQRPRGLEPCDQCGNWIGPWHHLSQVQPAGVNALPEVVAQSDPVAEPNSSGCESCAAINGTRVQVSNSAKAAQSRQPVITRPNLGRGFLLGAKPGAKSQGSKRSVPSGHFSRNCPRCGKVHTASVASRGPMPKAGLLR